MKYWIERSDIPCKDLLKWARLPTSKYHTWLKRYGKINEHNGKLERWHGSLKSECIRPSCPATKDEAEKRIAKYVHYYNTVRLHSAIGYVTPADCLAGLSEVIGEERDRKLEAARKQRQEKRAAAKQVA